MNETISLADIHDEDLEVIVQRLTAEDIERLLLHRNEFVELACAACHGTELAFDFEAHGLSYKRCTNCGLLMLSPAPDAARQFWYIENSEALRFWRERMPQSVRRSRMKMYDERVGYVRARLQKYGVAGRKTLEIGAGNGEFAEAFVRAADLPIERMVLVEPQPLLLELPQVEVINSIFEAWASTERFDLAVSWEVLEHVLDPDPLLHSIMARLRPGGLLVLSTPNENSLETRLLKGRSSNLLYDHVRLYNPHTIALLLQRVGFEVLEIETPGQLDVEILQREYKKGELDLSDQPALRFLMEDGLQFRAEFQNFLCKHKLSSHMRCVARRPD